MQRGSSVCVLELMYKKAAAIKTRLKNQNHTIWIVFGTSPSHPFGEHVAHFSPGHGQRWFNWHRKRRAYVCTHSLTPVSVHTSPPSVQVFSCDAKISPIRGEGCRRLVDVGCVEITVLALTFIEDANSAVIIFGRLVCVKVIKEIRQDFWRLVLPQFLACTWTTRVSETVTKLRSGEWCCHHCLFLPIRGTRIWKMVLPQLFLRKRRMTESKCVTKSGSGKGWWYCHNYLFLW